MPTINLPGTPYTDVLSNADTVATDIYDPTGDNSFEVLNGKLDRDNIDIAGGERIRRAHLQRRALNDGRLVGATANLDFFEEVFDNFDPAAIDTRLFRPIPGASIEFYVKDGNQSAVMLTWHLFAANDATDGERSMMLLFLDDAATTIWRRQVPVSVHGGTRDFFYDRTWCGHRTITSLAQGWHSASIRVASNAPQTRIRCRSMAHHWLW